MATIHTYAEARHDANYAEYIIMPSSFILPNI